MRQAAHYDLRTTEGLAQVQHLRFILPSGEVDTQYNGMTIRGGVLVDVIQDMPGSEIIDGRCALQLPRLAAGCHRYDVLVSDDGTDKPLLAGVIHVAPRVTPVDLDDSAPADYLDIVMPADEDGTITVISESPAWVDDAVEKSLQERGMYVNPVPGETVLTMSAGTSTRDFNYFTFALNSTYVSGHLAASYRLNQVALRTPVSEANGTRWMARLCRYSAGLALPLEVLGTSTSTASWSSINATTMECHWNFDDIAVSAADRLVLEVYAVDGSGATISKALIAYGAAASHGGTEGVLIASGGTLAWRNYSRLALSMSVAYDDSVSVGGIELASRRHFDALAASVAETGKQVADDADQVATDKQAVEDARAKLEQDIAAAQAILAAMPQVDDAGNMTLGGTITVTAGIINGQLVVNNPSGSIGNGTHNQIHGTTWFYDGVEFRNGVIIRGNTFLESGVLNISKAASINCNGPATYGATINANGGINIPLAVGAATDTTATSRAYALGMAHTVMMHQTRTYWLASSCTATNGVTINHVVPGLYCEARLGANEHTSLTMRTTGVIGGSNYNKILGYCLPIRNTGSGLGNWIKMSMLLGAGGEWTESLDAGIDGYRFRPVAGSSPSIARLVEVTLYYDDGHKARVRELIGIGNPRSYVVRTTTSAINHDSNTGLESAAYRLVIAQSNLSYNDELAAGVWLMIGGSVNDTVLKLADIRGWDTYHTSSAPSLYVDVQAGVYGGMVQMESPTILNGIGNNTYVRYGLEPYQRSWITTETEELYTEPNQPTE